MDCINQVRNKSSKLFLATLIYTLLLIGCSPTQESHPNSTIASETNQTSATFTISTSFPTEIKTQAVLTDTPAVTTTPETKECKEPSGNYEIIEINGHLLNKRTYEMLEYAASLYQGQIDIMGEAITQGSYTSAEPASFGTHSGGGAVDLSVMEPGTYSILKEEIEPLIQALRYSGFAAWYRDLDELYPGSPVHIHAIAIGDKELSLAAREQLAGPFGYFWGYNGLPTQDQIPTRDPHGGPIMCHWMLELGYPNKTATPSAEEN